MQRFALAALVVLLAAVPVASAQETNAPPGNSGVDQYLESVPSGSGNTSSKGVAASKPSPASPAVAKALRARGKSGAELQRLVASTAPATTGGSPKRGANRRGGQQSDLTPSAESGSGAVRAAAATTTGSGGGMGVWLPILLGIVALVAVVALVSRVVRRRHP